MSKFWEHYEASKPHIAGAVDDVRHKLVEEAWFGRPVTGNIAEPAMPEAKPEPETPSPTPGPLQSDAIYEEVWGKAPTYAQIYGQTADHGSAPAIAPPEPPQQAKGQEPEV